MQVRKQQLELDMEQTGGGPRLLLGVQSPGRGFWDQVFSFGGEAGEEEQNLFL